VLVAERRDRFVELGSLVEEAHRLERRRGDPRALRRLGLRRVLLASDELRRLLQRLGIARLLRRELRVDAGLRRARVLRELLRGAEVSLRGAQMVAALRLLLALLEHGLDDQRVELRLVRLARERGRRLEPTRPGLDVLVVLGAIERVEDQLAGGERE